jgi:DNA-binding XRE family transcriptional regulator
MTTNVQQVIEKQRAVYDTLAKPLLQQLSELHGLTIRDIAAIFKISKGHAEAVLKHRVFPSLELAVRIARYFETNVDELFAWRVDDAGDRRPLLVELPGMDAPVRITKYDERDPLALVRSVVDKLRSIDGGISRR